MCKVCTNSNHIKIQTNKKNKGGGSKTKGLIERIQNELKSHENDILKNAILCHNSEKAELQPWIGGCILSSMSAFNDVWVTLGLYVCCLCFCVALCLLCFVYVFLYFVCFVVFCTCLN